MKFLPSDIHSSWNEFLTPEIITMIHNIEQQIEKEKSQNTDYMLLPKESNVLIFLTYNLNNVKRIWLGQDPYPETYIDDIGNTCPVANGRAFWPENLTNWTNPIRQASIRNIMRNYYNTTVQHESDWRKIKKFSEIKEEIQNGRFQIPDPQTWFGMLENNGTLFLNASLTLGLCKNAQKPHKALWKSFTAKLITYITTKRPEAIWCVWGASAIECTQNIPDEIKEISAHPSRCTVDKMNFLKNRRIF